MGFYYRKSIYFSGGHFNFSKSEIGESVGVMRDRSGTNSQGNYIHMGRSGLFYRAVISKKKSNRRIATSQSPSLRQMKQPVIPQILQEELHFQDIDSGNLALIVDLSSQDIVNEINAKQKRFLLWPLAILFLFIPEGGILLAIIAAIMLLVLVDKKRKTTVLIYDIDEDTEQEIQRFYNAFNELAYDNFRAIQKNQRFIESGVVPRDSTVVDRTWQYVNKSGGPDKRFANNRQLPILMYSEIHFTSNSRLNELIQFSKQNAGTDNGRHLSAS